MDHQPRDFFKQHSLKLVSIVLVLVLLLVLSQFPYFNLIFEAKFITVCCLTLIAVLLPIKADQLVKTSLFLLIMALIFNLAGGDQLAEITGELIYVLLILAWLKKMVLFFRTVNDR